MNANVIQRGNRYSIVLDFGKVNGKRKQKWVSGFATETQATEAKDRMLREMERGDYIEPCKLTVGEWLDKWTAEYALHLSNTTQRNYKAVLGACDAISDFPLRVLKPEAVQAMYAQWQKDGTKASTIKTRHNVLHSVFEQAVKLELIARNPIHNVIVPRQETHEVRALTDKECEILLREAQGTALRMPLLLALNTGMRRGEILALRWDRIREDRIEIVGSVEEGIPPKVKEPKTKSSRRTVTIPNFVVVALKNHRLEQDVERLRSGADWHDLGLVFPDRRGHLQHPTSFSIAMVRLFKRCGVDASFHATRHTHATELMRLGFSPKVVQERLGHSSITLTMDTYSHVSAGMQEQVAEALSKSTLATGA